MTRPLDIVFLGLSLSSSWGNGHATTFRALIRGLHDHGHRVLFLERDVPWYAGNRDMKDPGFCQLAYYSDLEAMLTAYQGRLQSADAVIVGSFVPQGVDLIDHLAKLGLRRLCFYDIDTPITLAKLDRHDEEYVARRQMPLFETYYSFSGGKVLTRLEEQYGVRRAHALYCSVDSHYRNTDEPIKWDLGYLGTYSPDRQDTLKNLLIEPARRLPNLRFVVAGPQYPAGIDWPLNVDRIDHLPPAQHPRFYSRQRFTLNVTRADMIEAGWSPSVRLFEAAACGTPIISDYWRGLNELLPDREALIVARRTEDVTEVLTKLKESRRRAISNRAAAIVRDNHTGHMRARELVATLEHLALTETSDSAASDRVPA